MKGPLSRRAVEHHLDHLTEELSPKQLERLHSLAAAIGDDGHIPLNQALELATPGGDAVTAQASFRKFRQALRDAAVENRVDLELVSDNQKKAPEHRSCWFVGADTTVIGLAAMSQDAARMTRDTPIEAMAAEVIEKGPVVVYVSTARNPADTRIRKLEQEFVDKLRQRCAVRGDYAYDVVCADDSPLGREISAERERRRESADVVVALVSCAYLSDSGGDEEWVNSGRGRPLVLQALMQLPPPPLKTRLPLAEMHQRHKPFELCRGPERDTFVDECLSAIAARLSGQVGAPVSRHDGRMLDDWAKGTVDRRKAAEYTVVAMAQETDLRSPELGTARTRVLGQQTPAVDRLVRWATDDAAPPLCALLGDLGMGKTTTTRLFTEQLLARREQDPRVPLPILFDLRDLSIEVLREGPNLRRIVTALLEASEAVERRPSADELLDQVAEGGCVLIFDGLDEVLVHLEPADGQRFTHAMWRATEDTWRSGRRRGRPSRLLLSCRTHYFRSIRDEASHLTGQHRDGPVAESYLALLMLPFGDQQVRDYLRANVLGADVDALLKVIDDVHNLREIASRPLTLRMITEQLEAIERAKLAGREVRAVDLYGLFVEQWLDRDNGKHVLIPHHKQLLMEHLAARQWRSGVRGWTVDDVEQWLVDFLAARPDLERHYSERTPNLWKEDLRTATFLVRRNDDTFAFAHTSMQEFFLARYLFKALNSADLDAWQGPVPSRETLDFLGQLLAGLAPENQRAAVAGLAAQAALPGPSAVLTFAYALAAAKAGYPHHELNGSRLDDADLRDWEIGGGSRLVLHDAVFARANLTGAVFRDADLSGAVFDGADLTRAELHDSELRDAFLRDARVVGTILRSCDLTGARWDGAAIYRAQALWCRPAAPTDSPDWLVAPTDTAPAANARLTTLAGHTDALTSGAFSPDGTRILTTSHDHTARIWDTATGEPLLTLTNHTSGLTCGTFSPDGTRILTTGNDNTARIWDTATGETLLTLNGHTSGLTCGTFSPDGTRILTTGYNTSARIWDTATGETLLTLNGHTSSLTCGTFSPDGTRILTTSNDHTARIWDTTTGKTLLTLNGHTDAVTGGAFSPDGTRILTTGYDCTARIWDTTTGEPCDWMLEQFPRGHTVVWSAPDKRLLSASSEAWRWLGWLVPVDGKLVRLPAETYGPLPSEVVHGSTGAL